MTDDVQVAPTGRRARGGADARRALRGSTEVKQAGYIRRKMKPYEPFTDEQLELIEHNAAFHRQWREGPFGTRHVGSDHRGAN